MNLDPRACERARLSRDPRFDGRFYIGVKTTGIYCRPVCPAPPPKSRNVLYFPSAAAASEAGFRPCRRCRPEDSPGTPSWSSGTTTVARALRLVADGVLDEEGVAGLADRLAISTRHLNRLFQRHLGASPVTVAQTRRLHFAKKLIDETELSMARIAFAAGYGSIRRFNASLRAAYSLTPSELRRAAAGRGEAAPGILRLRLSFRPPIDWHALMAFLSERATPGVEAVARGSYARSISTDGHHGTIDVGPFDSTGRLELRIRFPESRSLLRIVERVRRIFDLDADPTEIAQHLCRDPLLASLVTAKPGLRAPGSWDGFELAVRAILGQQVTVKGATTLCGRLAEALGEPLSDCSTDGVRRLFPTPQRLANADLATVGLPKARARAIRRLAQAVLQGTICFDPQVETDSLTQALTRLPGIGEWTAQYIAMRALGDPDAFPASDLGLRRAVSDDGAKVTPRQLLARAEAWRPWRAYAAIYLWTAHAQRTCRRRSRAAEASG